MSEECFEDLLGRVFEHIEKIDAVVIFCDSQYLLKKRLVANLQFLASGGSSENLKFN